MRVQPAADGVQELGQNPRVALDATSAAQHPAAGAHAVGLARRPDHDPERLKRRRHDGAGGAHAAERADPRPVPAGRVRGHRRGHRTLPKFSTLLKSFGFDFN